ncbi:DNA sulfur modification protein DndB [uncultured Metabacillus sp.]|uniref:DNA sulfur modification protein DndB n=1 Tax=uncultured Metabacillus sp. TaxID=2860135 RepID=UPI0026021A4C|nr:DNA sulfur modification protein DndB [uncultured Metabacillus sp.]
MNEEFLTKLKGHYLHQFGHDLLVTELPFQFLKSIFKVDPHVQRELDPRRRNLIKEYILNTVHEHTFYFSPFVYSARGCIEIVGDHWEIKPGSKLAILEGQHRSAALISALRHLEIKKEALEEMPSSNHHEITQIEAAINKLESFPITMQIYLNLTTQEERQLFTDINTERKNAHRGLIMKYEQREEYVLLARHIAAKLQTQLDIETTLSRLTVHNTAITSLVVMRRCLLALFEGVLTHKEGSPKLKYCESEEMESISYKFFKGWTELFPIQGGNREKYVCGLSGIQIALAYTVYQLVSIHGFPYLQAIDELKKLKANTSWRHDDPLFSLFYDRRKKRLSNHSTQRSILKLTDEFLTCLANRGVKSNER